MKDRIEALHDDFTQGAVEGVLKSLPTEPTTKPPHFKVSGMAWAISQVREQPAAVAAATALLAIGVVAVVRRK